MTRMTVSFLVLIGAWAVHASVVTNAVALRGMSAEEAARQPRYEVTGVICSCGGHDIIVEADGVRFSAHNDRDRLPAFRTGDVVRLKGSSRLSLLGLPCHFFGDYAVVGHIDLPLPREVSPVDIVGGRYDMQVVSVRGTVTDVFRDDIDHRFVYLVLRANGVDVYVTTATGTERDYVGLLGADVRLTGPCKPILSTRLYMGRSVSISGMKDVEVLRPAETDPRVFPPLENLPHASPQQLAGLDRRRVCGTVLAAWQGSRLLVRTDDGRLHRIELMSGQDLPSCGDRITAGGIPETDFYHINLTHALVRVEETGPVPAETPVAVTPADILKNKAGEDEIDPGFFGRLVTLRGTLDGPLPQEDELPQLRLDCGGTTVTVDVGADPDVLRTIGVGSRLEVTGICLLDVPNWRPFAAFPKIRGFSLVVREPGDIRVLADAPWWTPARFWTLIGVLLASLVAIFTWSVALRRLVLRKGRELAREQIAHGMSVLRVGERTRLAVELHDTLSQNLAGLACQVASARKVLADQPQVAGERLETAERMLGSCRTELRNCLSDLRSDMLEEPNFETAIRRTLALLETDAHVSVRFAVPRARLLDSTAHAILCIVRELVSNAVRHGKATRVAVAGSVEGAVLKMSVRDNGTGFDPASCAGVAQGHFGLDGIRERAQRLGGTLEIESKAGKGTRAVVTIALAKEGA